ncbi:MAG TPA: AAA family ATPase, partial [Candidatus Elarobacter sp.]
MRAATAMVSERVLCPSFIGRAAELEHLRARRRLAGDGFGGGVLVTGEAGIGKSRLLREFQDGLTAAWTQSASTACCEVVQRPLEPLAEVFAQLLPDDHMASWKTLSKLEQFDAIVAAVERIERRRTAVVFIEDVHWGDIELVQILAELVRRAANQRIVFVLSCRDNEITASHPLFAAMGKVLREPALSRLALDPLDGDETARLLHDALGARAPLDAPTLHAIGRRSSGNPLFAEELLRHAIDHRCDRATAAARALPQSLQAVVLERLSGCTPQERAFLDAAAIFGQRFRI